MSTLENYRENLENLQNTVINLSWSSDSFKKQLLANPENYLREYGAPIPENIKVSIKEVETATPVGLDGNTVTLYIPAKPDYQDVQLSEKELEVVSGGAEASIRSVICSYSMCGDIIINL
ncbi:hypothetical protein V2E39_21460 [Chryseobacterium arthrosphaerae]|uniref:NHLP leader peptide family natural product n=1 Tax=Chryseobacterium arthrosphaerae TaxID=651561 RepID=A0A1B8ZHZ3_9FLAO|nr:hypothetical protein [Chryseobacterium arthrosphaerae]AYZ14351.1 hypothetical protein EGY05_21515 [Chryseobacterium arthrosphaerae]OCA71184.1 hypothetical protein BBI00_15680 [Chryseobacterium arthrosphaerae]RTZ50272.1 hypothetical protein EJ377_10415 [Chryseobacterium arthrosphaerae]